jgi:hypothetical protein
LFSAVDFHEDFVQIPSIPETTLLLLETPSKVGSEFPTPTPDGFVGNNNAAFGEEIFDITEAQTEAVIKPDGTANDFGREPMTVVARTAGFIRSVSQYIA